MSAHGMLRLALAAAALAAFVAPGPLGAAPHMVSTGAAVADSADSAALAGAADSIRALRIRQGWYPPADPESASVRLGRRDAPAVAMPFQGGARSLEALARAVLSNLTSGAPDSMLALCVTKQEFDAILWPEFPQSRPATGLTPMDGWRVLSNRLVSGTRGATADWGGRRWTLARIEATAGVMAFRNFDLHRGIVIVARDETGQEQRLDFVRTIAGRQGVFKLYSLRD